MRKLVKIIAVMTASAVVVVLGMWCFMIYTGIVDAVAEWWFDTHPGSYRPLITKTINLFVTFWILLSGLIACVFSKSKE